MSVNGDATETETETTPDVERAIGEITDRGAEIRAAQLERTLTQLRADGELTDAQRAAIERLSERLVERLLAVPRTSLRQAANRGDEEAIETALSLFDGR